MKQKLDKRRSHIKVMYSAELLARCWKSHSTNSRKMRWTWCLPNKIANRSTMRRLTVNQDTGHKLFDDTNALLILFEVKGGV
jgi:predicted chitinase